MKTKLLSSVQYSTQCYLGWFNKTNCLPVLLTEILMCELGRTYILGISPNATTILPPEEYQFSPITGMQFYVYGISRWSPTPKLALLSGTRTRISAWQLNTKSVEQYFIYSFFKAKFSLVFKLISGASEKKAENVRRKPADWRWLSFLKSSPAPQSQI